MTEEVSGIKSKPAYSSLQYDPKTRKSLFIGEGEGLTGLINLLSSSESIRSLTTSVMYTGSDTERTYAQSYFSPDRRDKISLFENQDMLFAELPKILADSHMGLRLYICGSEIFLWKVAGIARATGMHKSEYNMQLIGSKARRVYCPHCEATSEGVTTDIHECDGCGLTLVNCDHFSREMGAYLGFRVDAEVHGEIPERQELYR